MEFASPADSGSNSSDSETNTNQLETSIASESILKLLRPNLDKSRDYSLKDLLESDQDGNYNKNGPIVLTNDTTAEEMIKTIFG